MICIEIAKQPTPLGVVVIATRGPLVVALGFIEQWPVLRAQLGESATFVDRDSLAPSLSLALHRYFCGELDAFDGIEVDPEGTQFQRKVWAALRGIAPGTTSSYAAIAATVGSPRAVRAVGSANGRNPISLVIPCHRVIGSDGALRGYAGGVERKRWLLRHEGASAAGLQRAVSEDATVFPWS